MFGKKSLNVDFIILTFQRSVLEIVEIEKQEFY